MKTLIAFFLLCETVFGADPSVKVATTSTTDAEAKSISTKDVFSRDRKTDLVRDTKTKDGRLQIRIHRFYHDGALVGTFVAMPDSSSFTSEPSDSYSVSVEFDGLKNPKSAVIGTKDGTILDAFTCTSDMFSPVESSALKKANALTADMKRMFDPEHVRKTPADEFGREAQELVEKHKEK